MRRGIHFVGLVGAIILFAQPTDIGQDNAFDTRHGTILSWEVLPDKVIVVADSAVLSEHLGKLPGDCKIHALSHDTLFFYVGNLAQAIDLRTNMEFLSQERFAREAYSKSKAKSPSFSRLRDIGSEYSALVRPKIDEILKSDTMPSTRTTWAGFASFDESRRPRLIIVTICVAAPKGAPAYTLVPKIAEWTLNLPGSPQTKENLGVAEFIIGKTERAKLAVSKYESTKEKLPKRDREVYRLIAAVNAALDWEKDDPTVGPPVDAVVLESGSGIRWVKCKKKCCAAATETK